MRFRKRIKIFPGFHLNFSNSGISTTIGKGGLSLSIGKNGVYANTSIPGTGLYDRHKLSGNNTSHAKDFNHANKSKTEYVTSNDTDEAETSDLTSESFVQLKLNLKEAYQDKLDILNEINETKKAIKSAKNKYTIACLLIVGLFDNTYKNNIIENEDYLNDLEMQLNNCIINIDLYFEAAFESKYNAMLNSYKNLQCSNKVWDITATEVLDYKTSRSAAQNSLTRIQVTFKFDNISIIKSKHNAFHLENRNGGDIYIYPSFVLITSKNQDFSIIDFNDIQLDYRKVSYLENNSLPCDSIVIGSSWAKVNKDGTKDKRYAQNYEIPIVEYGMIELTTKSGLCETYMISSVEKSEEFVKCFNEYQILFVKAG